ncbi:hypothetical protein RDI58_024472 [Solanum bulbocastanum]|uniref:Uncharacterized protein n=1 Tax=Solanum bulbocastanum TaxID=147425 RepID=A0AAN8T1C4_SOLBU
MEAEPSSQTQATEREAGGRAKASNSTQPPRASSQATTNNENVQTINGR